MRPIAKSLLAAATRGWLHLAPRAAAPALAIVLGLATASAIVFTGPEATAKTSFDSAYGYDRTWNAALRMVRVDMGFKVTEKDDANGYLLFDYKSAGSAKPSSGSMEFVRTKEPDAPVKVVVQLSEMPRYHEQMMIDALAKKMRAEYGEPRSPLRQIILPPPPHRADLRSLVPC